MDKVKARNILLIEKLIINISEKITDEFKLISDGQQAAEAAKNYADKYKSRHGLLKLLGMPQGVSLESVYTPVQFLDGLSIRKFEIITNLEERYRDTNKRRLQIGKRKSHDGITIANNNQYLMILGNPGAGKSTFLKRIGLEALKGDTGKFQHDCIPVLIELKQFDNSNFDLIEAIVEEFGHFGFSSSKEFAIKALEEGKLLILLDGLDEVPRNFANSVLNNIDNLVTHYEKNRFIVSCRIAAYRSDLKHNFQVLELADFEDEQIKQFIFNWFSSELDKQYKTAEKCWDTLNHHNNKAAKELAQTPLLLTFLCLVYNRKLSFPPTRSRLYNKALDILLEEWAAEKRIQQEDIYKGLHTDLEKVMLAEIAYEGFINNQFFFGKQKIIDRIKSFLADTVDNLKYLDGQKVLKAIAAQQGVLVERAEDIYSFSHITLQEYLTAQYISQKDSLIHELIAECLIEKHWREIFLLVAGLKDDAGEILELIEAAIKRIINSPKLQNLLNWVKIMTNNSPEGLQPIGKRAVVLAKAITFVNAKAKALSIAYEENYETNFAKAREIILSKGYVESYAQAEVNSDTRIKTLAKNKTRAKAKAKAYENLNDNAFATVDVLTNTYASAYIYDLDTVFFKVFINIYTKPHASSYVYSHVNLNAVEQLIEQTKWLEKNQVYLNVNYCQIINTLETLKQQLPDDKEPVEVRQDFSKRITRNWLSAFNLTHKMLDLSDFEIEVLNNYFYANLLLIDCKNAAVKVSRKTWEGIESGMLLPAKN